MYVFPIPIFQQEIFYSSFEHFLCVEQEKRQVLALDIYRHLAGTSSKFFLPGASSSYGVCVCMMFLLLAGSCSRIYPEAARFYLH